MVNQYEVRDPEAQIPKSGHPVQLGCELRFGGRRTGGWQQGACGCLWSAREFLSLSAFGTGGRTAEFFPHFLHSAPVGLGCDSLG